MGFYYDHILTLPIASHKVSQSSFIQINLLKCGGEKSLWADLTFLLGDKYLALFDL